MNLSAQRWFVVCIEVVYLLILFGIALDYLLDPGGSLHRTLGNSFGPMPVGVPWFGAVGAVVISLSGAFDHRNDWDPSWNLWHFTRPLIGVTLAIVSWLIFQAGILSVGDKTSVTGTTSNVLFFLIAFIVGYREDVFRELIKRAADVILRPAQDSATLSPPVIRQINPATGRVAGNDPVTIAGSGFSGTSGVHFGTASATSLHVVSDGEITLNTPAGVAGVVSVILTTKGGNASAPFTYVP
jgi:IPT/TIG domain